MFDGQCTCEEMDFRCRRRSTSSASVVRQSNVGTLNSFSIFADLAMVEEEDLGSDGRNGNVGLFKATNRFFEPLRLA